MKNRLLLNFCFAIFALFISLSLNAQTTVSFGWNGLPGPVCLDPIANSGMANPGGNIAAPVPADACITDVNVTIVWTKRDAECDSPVGTSCVFHEETRFDIIAPGGTISLVTNVSNGPPSFDDCSVIPLITTVFDEQSGNLLPAGGAPFSTTYNPVGNLDLLNGTGAAGNWSLYAEDDFVFDDLVVYSWSLELTYISDVDVDIAGSSGPYCEFGAPALLQALVGGQPATSGTWSTSPMGYLTMINGGTAMFNAGAQDISVPTNVTVSFDSGCGVTQQIIQVIPTNDPGCALCAPYALNDLGGAVSSVCEIPGQVDYAVSANPGLLGQTINYGYVANMPLNAIGDPYAASATILTQVGTTTLILGNGGATSANFIIGFPAVDDCTTDQYSVVVWLTTATIANLSIPDACRPYLLTNTTVWPDPASATITPNTKDGCTYSFTSSCPNMIVSPSSVTLQPNALGEPTSTETVTVTLSIPGNECVASTTEFTLGPCLPDCPDIEAITKGGGDNSLDICTGDLFDLVAETTPDLIGQDIVFAYYSGPSLPVTCFGAPNPANPLLTVLGQVPVLDGGLNGAGAPILDISLPSNTSCEPISYDIYAYPASLVGYPEGCCPHEVIQMTVWPDPSEETVFVSSTDGCTHVFETSCPNMVIQPASVTIDTDEPSTVVDVTISFPGGACTAFETTVTVFDDVRFTAECPEDQTYNLNSSCRVPLATLPDWRGLVLLDDNCLGSVTIEQDPAPGTALGGLPDDVIPVDFVITNNTTGAVIECSTNIILVDTTDPIIYCPEDQDIEVGQFDDCESTIGDWTGSALATDNCAANEDCDMAMGYVGDWASDNWIIDLDGGNGNVTFPGAGLNRLRIRGSNSGSGESVVTSATIVAPCDGLVMFDWRYRNRENTGPGCPPGSIGANYDRSGYLLNGVQNQLTEDLLFPPFDRVQRGVEVVELSEGDIFGFYIDAIDDQCGRARTNNVNFMFVPLSDNGPITNITQAPPFDTPIGLGDMVDITLTATDDSGNSSSCIFTVTGVDQTAPVLVLEPCDVIVECGPDSDAMLAEWLANNGGLEGCNDTAPEICTGDNFLVNGSFEINNGHDQSFNYEGPGPDGDWFSFRGGDNCFNNNLLSVQSNVQSNQLNSEAQDGDWFLKSFCEAGTFQDVAVVEGDQVKASVNVKNDPDEPIAGMGCAVLKIEFLNANKDFPPLSFVEVPIDESLPLDVWTQITVEGIAPADAAFVRIVLYNGFCGVVLFDNAEMMINPDCSCEEELAVNGGFETGDFSGWQQFPSLPDQQFVGAFNPSEGSFAANINNVYPPPSASAIKNANMGIGVVNPFDMVTVSFDMRGTTAIGGQAEAILFSELDGGGFSKQENLGGPLFANADPNVWTSFEFIAELGPDVSGGVSLILQTVTGAIDGSVANVFFDNVSVTFEGECGPSCDELGACAIDNCDDDLDWTYELLYIDDHCFNTETRVYEFTVTDDSGNFTTARASFTTEDTQAPVFDTPLPPTEYSGANYQCQEDVPAVPTVTATDACGNVTIDFSETVAPGTCEDKFVVTRTWVAYDDCGNSDVFVQDITINDDTPPVIEGGEDITILCDQANANNDDQLLSWLVNNGGATATDNCSPVVWSNDYDVANFEAGCNNTRGIDVVFTATDGCGNFDNITLSYTVIDTIPPVFENCPRPDVVENAEKDHCDAYVNFGPPIAFDNCSDVTITNLSPYKPDSDERYESGDRFPIGTTIMTYEAEDACGNTTICKIKVIVNNYWETPEISCADDITMNNDDWECSAQIAVSNPDVTVLCPELAMTTYQITNDEGDVLETGLVDPAGPPAVDFEFPVGTSTVTYCVQDQPLLLISEISQDIDNECGGAPLAFDLPRDVTTNDCIEITNFGGVDYDLSCLVIERSLGDITETFVVPEDTTVEPGGTLTLCYGSMIPPIDAIDEGELCGEDLNGGGNADGCPLGSLYPGTTIAGMSFADNGTRDTDWFLLDFEGTCEVEITLTADFDAVLFKVGDACTVPSLIGDPPYGAAPGVPFTVTVSAAEFDDCSNAVIFVSPGDEFGGGIFDGIPCGTNNSYTLEVSEGTGDCACPQPIEQDGNDQNIGSIPLILSAVGPNGPTLEVLNSIHAIELDHNAFLHETSINLEPGDQALYKIYYNENEIDKMRMFADAEGGIIREAVKDTDTPADFILADVCTPISIGEYNPIYPAWIDLGLDLVASLQSVEAKKADCSVDVTVYDNEGPLCQMIDGDAGADDGFTVIPASCNEFVLTVGDCLAQDVTVSLNGDAIPTVSADLYTPSGDVIPLLVNEPFSGSLNVTLMAELYSAKLGGDWTLEVVTDKDWDDETALNFEIEATCFVDWVAPDDATVNLNNDDGLCSAEYSWTHPWAVDNCRDVTISVAYVFTPFNDLGPEPTVPEDLTLEGYGGQDATEIFSVGTTTVTYTLVDQYDNVSQCGFEVVVTDTEDPVITYCYPNDIDVFLGPGECRQNVTYEIEATDNCGVLTRIGYPPSGSAFEIGWTPVDVTVTDIHGNTSTCSFDVHVHEFEPESDQLACNNQIQLSLDGDCQAELTADMILEGDIYGCYEKYCMEITDPDGNVIFDALLQDFQFSFGLEHVNQLFTVKITDCLGGGNSCWGTVLVEEKAVPEIDCPDDIVIYCNEGLDPYAFGSRLGTPDLDSCEPFGEFSFVDDVTVFAQCSEYISQITRTWYFDDQQGNIVSCPQIITVMPIDLQEIEWPDDIDYLNPIECGDVADDPSLIEPDETGYPQLNGIDIFGSNGCFVAVNVSDEIYDICPGGYEILRTWKVRNMCGPVTIDNSSTPENEGNPAIHTQIIKVFDTEGPIMHECPDDIEVSTDPWTCSASTYLPIPETLFDKCSEVSFDATLFDNGLGGGIDVEYDPLRVFAYDLAIGTHTIRYTATDECGNVTICEFDVTVTDIAPPVAIALQNIVISLTSSSTDGNGVAKLFVEDVDNGSFDSCSDDLYYELRRADGANTDCQLNNGSCGARGNNTFSDRDVFGDHPYCRFDTEDGGQYVKFCCADIDPDLGYGLVDVIMRVWDDSDLNGTPGDIGSDNYNDTWATIRVEDKLPIQIQCPDDVTIDCFEDPEDTRLTGVATGTGTCDGLEATAEYDYSNVDQCGGPDGMAFRDGYVIITWTVESNGRKAECEQRVYIDAKDPFDVHDITWPGDIETDCKTPVRGEPSWNEVPCSLVGSSMEQQVFEFEEDACYKELNHWTIIDWCAYDPTSSPQVFHDVPGNPHYDDGTEGGVIGIWTHTQIVKVIDTSKPVLTCEDQPEWATEDCLAQNVELTNSATDEGSDCPSPWLKWEVCLDINYDWNCDHIWTSDEGMATQSRIDEYYYVASSSPGEEITLPVLDDFGNAMSSNEPDELDLPIGTHRVLWTVNDGCGNVASCTQFINVTDGKAPTPYCIQNLSTAVMDHGGTVEIWASDFDLASEDNCTAQEDLLFSFSGDAYVPNMLIECDDLEGEAFKIFDLEMWVWDEAANRDFCFVQLRVNDNGVCSGEGRATVAGNVQTRFGDMVENTQVSINSVLPEFPISQVTEEDGSYAFEQIPMYNNYDLAALRNDDHGNGVSTLDMVIIIRHVIGLESLDDPYRSIAADVNSDKKISSLDLIQMRRLILGITDEFPQNDSWRFVDAAQSFAEANNPWPFTEILDLPLISADMMSQDFVGVKIGDVSGDAEANSFMSTEVRTNASLKLETDEQVFETGDIVTVAISSEEFDNVYGYQFTFNVDGLSYQGVEPGVLDITEDNLGLHRVSEGLISTTWSSSEAVTTNDVLFTLVFRAETDAQLSNLFSISSEITKAEAYRSSALSIEGVEIGFRTDNGLLDSNPFALYQNQPNPFSDVTQIGFVLPESGEATMTIYDVTGKVVKIVEGDYSKGYNEVSLKRQDLGMAGMLYYQLDAGDHTATKKMIIVK